MAKVLVFNNYVRKDQKPLLAQLPCPVHQYTHVTPGKLYADPYKCKRKHMRLTEFIKRLLACVLLRWKSRAYDILILDTSITGLLMSCFLVRRKKLKVIIYHFNVLRRRGTLWRMIGGALFRRIDHFCVHSTVDIELASALYHVPQEQFTFLPYVRTKPSSGEPTRTYMPEDNKLFILSFGVNARDYRTFLSAMQGIDVNAVVVAREYNLEGLTTPKNVRAFCNIPLEECDKLVSKCLFTVFTFDGSEPSCGQISIVTSFMLGKPTICTDWMGVHDYVTDGDNGLLVKMKDPDDLRSKIIQLANDKKLYTRLSEGSRLWAERNANPMALQQKIDSLVTKLTSDQVPAEH